MADYILSCESPCDLTNEHLEERNIKYVPFNYSLGGTTYRDDLWKSMRSEEFYERLHNGEEAKSSQVNAEQYKEYFTPFLEDGYDILHLALSSGLSGTINSALIAKEELAPLYPERKIVILDSLAASSGFGLLMDEVATKRDEGMSIMELADWVENQKEHLRHEFTTTDLTQFIRGGRVSKTSGFVGGLLNICPILNVNDEGRLVVRDKVKGKKRAMRHMIDVMKEVANDGADYDGKIYLSNSNIPEDAREMANLIEEAFPKMDGKVEIFPIGPTIGSHTGHGTIAIFFWGKSRPV